MTPMFLAAALIVAAPLKPQPPQADPHIGRWAAQSLYVNGEVSLQHMGLEYEFTRDGTWIIYRDGKVIDAQARAYKADRKAKPTAIDLTENDGTMLGIYKIEGELLTVSFTLSQGGERPNEFDPADKGVMMLVMQRVKVK